MILVGGGALLRRGLDFALEQGARVDLVVSGDPTLSHECRRRAVRLACTSDVNRDWAEIRRRCSDGVLFSLNNPQIFRPEVVSAAGMRMFNVHNGPIPAYRGRPEVCLVFALLAGETRYGVTLHEIDAGIDTGPTLDVLHTPISAEDDFESVMLRSLELCDEVFRRNLQQALAGTLQRLPRAASPSRLFRLRDLEALGHHVGNPNLERATRFGAFENIFCESFARVRRHQKPTRAW